MSAERLGIEPTEVEPILRIAPDEESDAPSAPSAGVGGKPPYLVPDKLTSMADERLIGPHDFARIRALIHAFETKVIDGEHGPLWEVLRDTHADYLSENPPLPLDDLVGDEAVSREINHARLVLERLMRGVSKVPATPARSTPSRCATPGCGNLTYGTQCEECELLGPESGH
jgi:hypothetical protein